jgi:L-alanine-DL-glutamate epimerase-like enolase superfamily enzyme
VKPRWLFLKIHTDAGITGLGEPVTEGRSLTCQTAVKEIEPYLIGKDPRAVVHHWQAIYRHAFYRGGPILTSALSGIDRRCGTSRARRSACRCTNCWAGRRAAASASTRTRERPRR